MCRRTPEYNQLCNLLFQKLDVELGVLEGDGMKHA